VYWIVLSRFIARAALWSSVSIAEISMRQTTHRRSNSHGRRHLGRSGIGVWRIKTRVADVLHNIAQHVRGLDRGK
jgi:hypothetical protein